MRLVLMKFITVHIKVVTKFIGNQIFVLEDIYMQMTGHCTVRIKYKEKMFQAMEIITDKWNALKSFKGASKIFVKICEQTEVL